MRPLPEGPPLSGREPQQLQRVTVGIAKLESAHTAISFWQGLGAVERDGLHASRADAGVSSVHVRYNDCEMLEPEIGALAIRGVWPTGARELRELDLLITELHRQHIHWPGRQAEQSIQK